MIPPWGMRGKSIGFADQPAVPAGAPPSGALGQLGDLGEPGTHRKLAERGFALPPGR
jgi:hypothetical protein